MQVTGRNITDPITKLSDVSTVKTLVKLGMRR